MDKTPAAAVNGMDRLLELVEADEDDEADEAGAGASLFTLSETAGSEKGIRVPTRRRRHALNRFAQDKVVSPGGGEVAITATQ